METYFRDELSYYLMQTKNTKLDKYRHMVIDIQDDINSVFISCRNAIEHYNGINASHINKSRYWEIEIDQISDILSLLSAKGINSLSDPIPFDKKIIGSCFNISKLAVALLRNKGIPARLRYAYCTYFNHKNNPYVYSEQVLVEYWDDNLRRWLRGDPSMNWEILDHLGIKVNVNFLDVTKSLSQPIADVWINCRNGLWNFDDYGVCLGDSRRRTGMGHVALKMTHDHACLNQLELYMFDFISPSKRFQEESNLRPADFDDLASALFSEDFNKFHFTNKNIPFSTLPRRVLRKSPLTGNSLKKGIL